MPDAVLRPFAWSDVPAIREIYRPYVEDTVITFETEVPSETEMAERMGRLKALGHPLIVAEEDGEVVGYAYASYYRPRGGWRFTCEDSIYLRQDKVGRGLGSRLLAELIVQSRAVGFTQMVAVITAERANSVRVHEKAGFRFVGRYENVGFKFDQWLDIVHLQLAL